MNIAPEQTSLIKHLHSLNPIYHGKIFELRDAVQGWLAYIPASFPHYTRHTVQHSDEIIVQISKLLFASDGAEPTINLSAAEIYILCASAYLHDSGMVTAEQEKMDILRSDAEWASWISGEGGGAKRWNEIQEFRKAAGTSPDSVKQFVADLQTRYLIGEFIRRKHHLRASDVIQQYQAHLGRFAFDDPLMQRTISDICVAHGLMHYELEDRERFPERRDIQGHTVNVRLLAILLRLGDLLDLSSDRSCPLLLNAANPLPADSYAHWSQYQRITHRATSPNRIEITAECLTQDEHRVLQDWCQWIVDETRNAKILISRAELHNDWLPPSASIGGADATIKIRRAPNATYIPSNWSFELDHSAVLQLLIRDVYQKPQVFIRELIQNALDATRCQIYADLVNESKEPPEYPTQIEEDRRRRYPVMLRLENRSVQNPMSGESEERQVLRIEDNGIGMDREVIARYFLQIGRSFYTTEEFRRSYKFTPTSRFGVGFLSVFAVSDHVTIDTYKPRSPKRDEPIRLTLRGPRSYLLTEQGTRRTNGTSIEVYLQQPMDHGELTNLVREWCARVEFPIFVDDLGTSQVIEAERPEQFINKESDISDQSISYVIRSFPIGLTGMEGEFYIFAKVDKHGERWDWKQYAASNYLKAHPQAMLPELPNNLICYHGIVDEPDRDSQFYYAFYDMAISTRIDFRRKDIKPVLSRFSTRWPSISSDPELMARVEEIVLDHLNSSAYGTGPNGWIYKQRLVKIIPLSKFWAQLPEMLPVYIHQQLRYFSLADTQLLQRITTIHQASRRLQANKEKDVKQVKEFLSQFSEPVIAWPDVHYISEEHSKALYQERDVTNIRWIGDNLFAVDWCLVPNGANLINVSHRGTISLAELPSSSTIGIALNPTKRFILNANHQFTKWYVALKHEASKPQSTIRETQVYTLEQFLFPALENNIYINELQRYIRGWNDIPDLDKELYPPTIEIQSNMFTLGDMSKRGSRRKQ